MVDVIGELTVLHRGDGGGRVDDHVRPSSSQVSVKWTRLVLQSDFAILSLTLLGTGPPLGCCTRW
ncbi:hypothetical protein AB0D24_39470 [Streptomyces javensis]|uniref:hypothetical protein n=1 Tax=Streptomyces javensis TaxID=114698 RepID=UPI0033EF805B